MPLSFSKSSASDQRIAATDEAQVANRSGMITNPNSIAVGSKGTYNSGVDLSKSKGTTLNIGASGAEILQLTDTFSDTVARVTAETNDSLERALNAQSQFQKEVLGSLSSLSESSQTGGQSGTDKRMLWLALAALAIVLSLVLRGGKLFR